MYPPSIMSVFVKCAFFIKWHGTCISLSKSLTLISFLLKKAYFVPQSRPFSIMAICKYFPNVPVVC